MDAKTEKQVEEYIFRSKLPDIYIPNHLPLHSYCFENISQFSERPCVINGATGEIYTYADVELTARKVASGLNKIGIEQGDVIMLLLQNCPEFVFTFLGASYRGAICTTANPFYTPGEIVKQALASKAKLIITQSMYAEKVKEFAIEHNVLLMCIDGQAPSPDDVFHRQCTISNGETKTTVLSDQHCTNTNGDSTKITDLSNHHCTNGDSNGETKPNDLSDRHCTSNKKSWMHFSELTQADENEIPAVKINSEDVVALPYSSGTTGLPKGVMLSHKGLVTSVAQQVDGENPNLYFKKEDVVMCVLPLFHIYSLNSVLLCALRVGAAILIMQKFEILALMELVQKYKVTIAPFVPPIVLAIAKSPLVNEYDLSSIRTVMSGAAPMGKELEDTVRAKLPNAKLGQGYGMTEAGPVLSMCLAFAKEPMEIKSGSCGTVVRNAEMKIIDPETSLSLPKNQSGEICIRGSQIMKGYLNDPESTKTTIDEDGWLHTGDIGYIDDDEELFIVDRLKELIKYKGFQVAPAELEGLLVAHPNLSDAAVVSMADEAAGELPVAFVIRSNGSKITEDEIKQYISKQVVFYKRIHRVFFMEAIPKAQSGKILRKELRAKIAAGLVK